jgi:predicted RNase H-like HicB family nuclease
MRAFTAVVEKRTDTGLYVGYVPGFPGAHTQAETLDELRENLREVIEMLLEDGVKQYRHSDGRSTTVSFHPGRDISPILLRKIASDIGLAIEKLLEHK